MTEPVLARELEQIRDAMTDGFRGVHDRLDRMDGRQRATEAIAQVLGDRSERDERNIAALSEGLAAIQTKGCAVGQMLHGAPPDGSWWTPKKTAGVAVGGSAIALGLIELGKVIVQALGK